MPDSHSISSEEAPLPAAQSHNGVRKPTRTRIGSRRAQTACAFCRWRKVRCNVEEGTPCSNCAFEEVECIVVRKKQRRNRHPYNPHIEISTGSPERVTEHTRAANQSTASQDQLLLPTRREDCNLESDVSLVLQEAPAVTHETTYDQHLEDSPLGFGSVEGLEPPFDTLMNEPISPSQSRSLPIGTLPDYLAPLPTHMDLEDADYLRRKGVLSVPEPVLRDALIRSYIEYIHPTLPVLDLHDFVKSINAPASRNKKLSLLLFQAVMFAGISWIDIRLLRKLGFLTRKSARKSLFHKVRILYDSDYEQDRLVLVQTMVLLSLWWEAPDAAKDGWHWIGLATSMARTIDLNRDPATLGLDIKMQRLRKRIWWSCLIRDPIVSIGTSRPTRIRIEDFNVPMLTLDDFDIEEIPADVTCVSPTCDIARNTPTQRQFAIMCIETAKLCRHMSKILEVEYADLPRGHIPLYSDRNVKFEKISSPPSSPEDSNKLESCEDELRRWREELPRDATYTSPSSDFCDSTEQILYVHRAMLAVLYFNAIGILHRPRVLQDSTTLQESDCPTQDPSRRLVRYAAAQVTKIASDMYQLDIARLLPPTCISCLIPASMSHIDDLGSENEAIRVRGRLGLEQCRQFLLEHRDGHFAADFAVTVLDYVASRVKQRRVAAAAVSKSSAFPRNETQRVGGCAPVSPCDEVSNSTQSVVAEPDYMRWLIDPSTDNTAFTAFELECPFSNWASSPHRLIGQPIDTKSDELMRLMGDFGEAPAGSFGTPMSPTTWMEFVATM